MDCIVCYEPFAPHGDFRPFALPCGHSLCKTCLDGVYSTSRRCPNCRHELPRDVADIPPNYALIERIHPEQKLDPANVTIGEVLSTAGNQGTVYHGTLTEGTKERKVAVKCFGGTLQERKAFSTEVAALLRTAGRCHGVSKIYGWCEKDAKVCIVMKVYRGSLQGELESEDENGRPVTRPLPPTRVAEVCKDICSAMAELHEQNVLVLDLKPDNILITDRGQAVVADLGLSRMATSTIQSIQMAGTPVFMAPEVYDGQYHEGSDVWAFATMLCILASGQWPFQNYNIGQLARAVGDRGEHAPIPSSLSLLLQETLEECFSRNPSHRPSFGALYDVFVNVDDAVQSEREEETQRLREQNQEEQKRCQAAEKRHIERERQFESEKQRHADEMEAMKREMEAMKREMEAMKREMEAMKREMEQIRAGDLSPDLGEKHPPSAPSSSNPPPRRKIVMPPTAPTPAPPPASKRNVQECKQQ